MHPNAFLKSLWRSEVINQVFVAMSFEERFQERYESVIRPAIEEEPVEGFNLKAYRVDNSKTGDSILSEIIDGIAHSRLVLADVSVIDEGRYNETPIRNGNVMYEVGVALACRTPAEVLLVRDDSKKFLFDISTIPHMQIDFKKHTEAIVALREAIGGRLREANLINDSRIQLYAKTLTTEELIILNHLSSLLPNQADSLMTTMGIISIPNARGLQTLISKGCVHSVANNPDTKHVFYKLTEFGHKLLQYVEQRLPSVSTEKPQRKK